MFHSTIGSTEPSVVKFGDAMRFGALKLEYLAGEKLHALLTAG